MHYSIGLQCVSYFQNFIVAKEECVFVCHFWLQSDQQSRQFNAELLITSLPDSFTTFVVINKLKSRNYDEMKHQSVFVRFVPHVCLYIFGAKIFAHICCQWILLLFLPFYPLPFFTSIVSGCFFCFARVSKVNFDVIWFCVSASDDK